LATIALSNSALAQDEATLTIGDKAPDIDIETWISDNDGMFQHTTKLEDDQVYVIEFWATWCGPCIKEMPRFAKLQEEYKEEVQIISVSDEDLDTIDTFLERKVPGDEKKQTFGELTNSYCLTTDTDKSVKKDYFYAAKRTGIPCAFIVGKTGLIEWIGHPARMEKPLKQVVDGEWDRESFVAEYKKEQDERATAMKIRRKLATSMRQVSELMKDGDPEGAVELLEEFIMDDDFAPTKQALIAQKLEIMVKSQLDGAADALTEFAKDNKDNAMGLNTIAWNIYEQHANNGDVTDEVLKAARTAAELAAKADPENGAILDTLGHLIYAADGDLDKAIEVQTKAVEHAGVQINEIKPFLDMLKKEKETGEKPKKKKKSQDTSDF